MVCFSTLSPPSFKETRQKKGGLEDYIAISSIKSVPRVYVGWLEGNDLQIIHQTYPAQYGPMIKWYPIESTIVSSYLVGKLF